MTEKEPEKTAMKPTPEAGGAKEKEIIEAGKKGGGRRWILYVILAIIIILAAAYLTIGVVFSPAPAAASYPYTTTYQVFFPTSDKVTIGNTDIIAIPVGNRVTLSINGQSSDMNVGETRTIQERRATISILFVKILDFDFRVDATYRGQSGSAAEFYLAFHTSQQVPSFLISRLLPASVQARPV
jgi:hypothetical protein